MKKIMFNDRFCLTQAVLEGRKTQRRIIIKPQPIYDEKVGMVWKGYASGRGMNDSDEPHASYRNFVHNSPMKVGEIIAVAQSYNTIINNGDIETQDRIFAYMDMNGYNGLDNKMFVKPNLMPHQIKITNVRIERLQEISDDDCIAEGVQCFARCYYVEGLRTSRKYAKCAISSFRHGEQVFSTPREAFSSLIDRINGAGTWKRNPYVFVYEFELIC